MIDCFTFSHSVLNLLARPIFSTLFLLLSTCLFLSLPASLLSLTLSLSLYASFPHLMHFFSAGWALPFAHTRFTHTHICIYDYIIVNIIHSYAVSVFSTRIRTAKNYLCKFYTPEKKISCIFMYIYIDNNIALYVCCCACVCVLLQLETNRVVSTGGVVGVGVGVDVVGICQRLRQLPICFTCNWRHWRQLLLPLPLLLLLLFLSCACAAGQLCVSVCVCILWPRRILQRQRQPRLMRQATARSDLCMQHVST